VLHVMLSVRMFITALPTRSLHIPQFYLGIPGMMRFYDVKSLNSYHARLDTLAMRRYLRRVKSVKSVYPWDSRVGVGGVRKRVLRIFRFNLATRSESQDEVNDRQGGGT